MFPVIRINPKGEDRIANTMAQRVFEVVGTSRLAEVRRGSPKAGWRTERSDTITVLDDPAEDRPRQRWDYLRRILWMTPPAGLDAFLNIVEGCQLSIFVLLLSIFVVHTVTVATNVGNCT